MKLYSYSFQPEGDNIELVGIADLHRGAHTFNQRKACAHRAYILSSPDRKVVDLGDSTENALRDSPGRSLYDQVESPSAQREWVKEYYEPLKGRVLGVCASNHSARSERTADISPDELLAAHVDAPYIRFEAILSITVGDSASGYTYNIYVRHGIGNPCTRAGLAMKLTRKAAKIQGCDAYWCGHSHTWFHEPATVTIPDPRHGRVKVITQHLLASDSFMEYDDSYAEECNYERPVPGQVSLKLYKNRRLVEPVRLLY